MFVQNIMQLSIGYIFGSGSARLGITESSPAAGITLNNFKSDE
jgi:hypothetical protein